MNKKTLGEVAYEAWWQSTGEIDNLQRFENVAQAVKDEVERRNRRSPTPKHSAEFLRGRINGIEDIASYMWEYQREWPIRFQNEVDQLRQLLAEAEAREESFPHE